MQPVQLNANRRLPALVHGADEPWHASPEAGVDRVLLERDGGEIARASSIVRYRPGSRFAGHVHELGEEYLVLDGCFSDEHGHHRAGCYVRNPPGSRHAPFSEGGCTIFVKLRQMRADDSASVCVEVPRWCAVGKGHDRATLFIAAHEEVFLDRLAPDVELSAPTGAACVERFVLQGRLAGEDGREMRPWSWSREPCTTCSFRAPWRCTQAALVWTKIGLGRS